MGVRGKPRSTMGVRGKPRSTMGARRKCSLRITRGKRVSSFSFSNCDYFVVPAFLLARRCPSARFSSPCSCLRSRMSGVVGLSLPSCTPPSPGPPCRAAYPPLLVLCLRSVDAGRSAAAWAFAALQKLNAARKFGRVLAAAANECVRREEAEGRLFWERFRDDLVRASCAIEFALADVRRGAAVRVRARRLPTCDVSRVQLAASSYGLPTEPGLFDESPLRVRPFILPRLMLNLDLVREARARRFSLI